MRLQTCEPASTVLRVVPVRVLRKRMVRSAVPPPETRRPCWWGDQVMALTAAMWSLNLRTGQQEWLFQTSSLLSLPPEQSCCQSQLHFNPHISCLWPTSLLTKGLLALKSRCRINLSREPVLTMFEFQAIAPTRFVWPDRMRILFILLTSQICTYPLFVPRPSWGPFRDQDTEVAESEMPRSQSLVTLELVAFQRQTLEASPTAKKFCVLQSMRFKQQSSCSAGASKTLQGNLLTFLFLFVRVESQSVNSKLVFLCKLGAQNAELPDLRLYLSILLFSKESISLSLF